MAAIAIIVGDQPIAVITGEGRERVESLVADILDSGFQESLKERYALGVPMWDGKQEVTFRDASEQEERDLPIAVTFRWVIENRDKDEHYEFRWIVMPDPEYQTVRGYI